MVPSGGDYTPFALDGTKGHLLLMNAFGDQLRQERESRGIALEEIAASTKISRHHLEALEEGRLERLPGGAFNKGFVRAYAEFVGIDARDAIQGYLREERAQGLPDITDNESVLQAMARLATHRRHGSRAFLLSHRGLRPLLVALPALVLLAGAGWWLLGRSAPASRPPEPQGVAVAAPASPPPVAPSMEPPPAHPTVQSSPAADGEAREPPPVGPHAAGSPPAEPAPAVRPRLRVSEFGTGMDVIDRTLVGPQNLFREGTRAWFWTRVLGGADGDVVEHVWLHEGQEAARHSIRVGGPHWRVYTRQTLFPGSAGRWAVEARDSRGGVLARGEFEVVAN